MILDIVDRGMPGNALFASTLDACVNFVK